jgi:transcriptional regulator with PAS, ATPase and Fis domain
MSEHDWVRCFPGAVTVTDEAGIIIEMNEAAAEAFRKDGGEKLVGSGVLDCHPEPSRTRLQGMMQAQTTNIYTIEKSGRKKLIYQTPWYRDGQYAGFVEISLEIPREMPHFVRT